MLNTQLDHLVVMAADLDSGVRWCEQTLGVSPSAGGEHPLMGTHNRLVKVASCGFEDAYLEIIALKPDLQPTLAVGRKRWFDFDDATVIQKIEQDGPQLMHWVARTSDLEAACSAWMVLGIDRGPGIAASRKTAHGLLQWQITVREDGARLFDGCLPTLIQWGDVHPAQTMDDSGVGLVGLSMVHPQADWIRRALDAAGIERVQVQRGAARLQAELHTPKGRVLL